MVLFFVKVLVGTIVSLVVGIFVGTIGESIFPTFFVRAGLFLTFFVKTGVTVGGGIFLFLLIV